MDIYYHTSIGLRRTRKPRVKRLCCHDSTGWVSHQRTRRHFVCRTLRLKYSGSLAVGKNWSITVAACIRVTAGKSFLYHEHHDRNSRPIESGHSRFQQYINPFTSLRQRTWTGYSAKKQVWGSPTTINQTTGNFTWDWPCFALCKLNSWNCERRTQPNPPVDRLCTRQRYAVWFRESWSGIPRRRFRWHGDHTRYSHAIKWIRTGHNCLTPAEQTLVYGRYVERIGSHWIRSAACGWKRDPCLAQPPASLSGTADRCAQSWAPPRRVFYRRRCSHRKRCC